jgi:hypothetical protein
MPSAPPPGRTAVCGPGQADLVDLVQDGVKGEAGSGGNVVLGFGLDKGIERAGWFREYEGNGYSGVVMPAGGWMTWVANRFCGYPGLTLTLVSSRLFWKVTADGLMLS